METKFFGLKNICLVQILLQNPTMIILLYIFIIDNIEINNLSKIKNNITVAISVTLIPLSTKIQSFLEVYEMSL